VTKPCHLILSFAGFLDEKQAYVVPGQWLFQTYDMRYIQVYQHPSTKKVMLPMGITTKGRFLGKAL